MASASNLITALRQVRPGDLITATFFNDMIGAIWELEGRISVLEAEGRFVVPEDGGEPVRQTLVIKSVVARRRETTLSFEVFGTGLKPAGLKNFLLNEKPFRPTDLQGDDERITFRIDLARLEIHADFGEFHETRDSRDAGSTGDSGGISRMLGTMSGSGSHSTRAFGGVGERIVEIGTPTEPNLLLTIEASSGARASRRVEVISR
ncbi:MAG TPA: hypothetical protein VMN38_02000 [Sphingomicrobium sp.]|nr:hypothetical protein [Sphingomicrobium sp.]